MARRTSRPKLVTLDDPRAIRALAHEARQQVIVELYGGEVLTATEAARICQVTPSAMSYHLRALQKWGIVERDDSATDGRERRWRAAADSLNIGAGMSEAAGPVTTQAFLATYLKAIHRAVADWGGKSKGGTDRSVQLSRGRIWLDDEESAELNRELSEVMARYDDRTAADHPEGTTAREVFWINVPRVSDPRQSDPGTR